MGEKVGLLHATAEDTYRQVVEEGVKTNASRGTAGDLVQGQVKHNVVYLFDPEEAADYLVEEYASCPTVECEVDADDLYVARWPDWNLEKAPMEDLYERRPTYEEWQDSNIYDNDSVMFLYTNDIPPEQVEPASGKQQEPYPLPA